jgi:hypothetical protein
VTHPFVAMIFATGFAAPLSLHAPDDRPILSWRSGGGAIAALMFVFLLGSPLISHVIRMTTAFDSNIEINHEDLIIVPGGRFMTGFLVLPDTADLPREEPALHASTFARMISIYNIDPEPRLSDLVPQVPFALVYSPVQNRPHTTSNYQTPSTYLTSSTVLTDKSPRRWVLRLGRCSVTSNVLAGLGFCLVEEAKPVEAVIDARWKIPVAFANTHFPLAGCGRSQLMLFSLQLIDCRTSVTHWYDVIGIPVSGPFTTVFF